MPEAEDIVIPHTLLLKLPTEIICQILDYMTLYDLQAITLTCRQIRETFRFHSQFLLTAIFNRSYARLGKRYDKFKNNKRCIYRSKLQDETTKPCAVLAYSILYAPRLMLDNYLCEPGRYPLEIPALYPLAVPLPMPWKILIGRILSNSSR